ncbi:LytTR family DNA-binding domain-containing protein [Pseudomonas sp.]|jgi:DNA-binding LytR/AlgR family response regulator|uniref:LytTR family DNA-binding domain-containing protein n=1 Tax=Pseudomonas sp. TaxID=306 RepID=UPI002ED8B15A
MLTSSPSKTLPEIFEETHGGRVIRKVLMADVTHFRSQHKYLYACNSAADVMLDNRLGSLEHFEQTLGDEFVRVHRSTLVRRSCIETGYASKGGYMIKLRGSALRLSVARNRVAAVRQALAAGQGASKPT